MNLVISGDGVLKVTDFGLSRIKNDNPYATIMTGACGTFQWMAPEVMANARYSEKADVYSFAINMWELATRDIPYDGTPPMGHHGHWLGTTL